MVDSLTERKAFSGFFFICYLAEKNETFKTIHFKIEMTVPNFSINDEGLFLTKSEQCLKDMLYGCKEYYTAC